MIVINLFGSYAKWQKPIQRLCQLFREQVCPISYKIINDNEAVLCERDNTDPYRKALESFNRVYNGLNTTKWLNKDVAIVFTPMLQIEKTCCDADLASIIHKTHCYFDNLNYYMHEEGNTDLSVVDKMISSLFECLKVVSKEEQDNWELISQVSLHDIQKKLNVNKIRLLAVIGKSATGKDTLIHKLRKILPEDKYNIVIKTTTRPRRVGEFEDLDYHFLSDKEFKDVRSADGIVVSSQFNSWHYGIQMADIDKNKINIVEMNPTEYETLKNSKTFSTKVIYLLGSKKLRLQRAINRAREEDIDEVIRRYHADEEDFKGFQNKLPCNNNLVFKVDEFNFNNAADDDIKELIQYLVEHGQRW